MNIKKIGFWTREDKLFRNNYFNIDNNLIDLDQNVIQNWSRVGPKMIQEWDLKGIQNGWSPPGGLWRPGPQWDTKWVTIDRHVSSNRASVFILMFGPPEASRATFGTNVGCPRREARICE